MAQVEIWKERRREIQRGRHRRRRRKKKKRGRKKREFERGMTERHIERRL